MNQSISLAGNLGWTQNARIMRLLTPIGADALLAESACVEETLGPVIEHAGYRISMTAVTSDAGLDLLSLLGQPVRLDLLTAASRTALRPFHGHVTRIERVGANGGFARYAIVIEPWLAFLGHNRDCYVFQEKTVIQIVDEVLSRWSGKGPLMPAWRWALAEPAVYPKRGTTAQYQESDLDFLRRLLAEEGLFCWFEHAAANGEALGSHSLVIADHNGAFGDNAQAWMRFTQSGATMSEDSIDRWEGLRQVDTTELAAVSWDYRARSGREQRAACDVDNGAAPHLIAIDDPGQYAWQTREQGARMLANQGAALAARTKRFIACGTVRSAAPGTRFALADHPEHDRDAADSRQFLITSVTHHARNNLSESIPGALDALGPALTDAAIPDAGWKDSVDLYRNRFECVRASTSWKPLLADARGRWLHPRPTARGPLTGLVVGGGTPTHTDRDLRIRVQLHWQRGSQSASRLEHPSGADNAPGNAALGVWLRVLTPVAGGNWGGHFVPRPGQEVVVAFDHGNIDRPVVIGAVYNGQGHPDAAGNRVASGVGPASANAPAFFAGGAEGHRHGAALAGIKTQQLATSRNGQGGYNQLVFDDVAGEARIELGTTQFASQLQLGHLKDQRDNARMSDRGHGIELATHAAAALRAGGGLLVSADARSGGRGHHLDSCEPAAAVRNAHALLTALGDIACTQRAILPGDRAAETLPAAEGLAAAAKNLMSTRSAGPGPVGNASSGRFRATQGGDGTVAAWQTPRIQYAAPSGVVQLTPANAVVASGGTTSLIGGQQLALVAQGNHATAIKDGIVLFTGGKTEAQARPNQETGIHLHAALGKVSLQAQGGKLAAAADRDVTVASTAASVEAQACGHLLATAQGACLRLEGGNIHLHAPGKVAFKASRKNWTGPAAADGGELRFPQTKPLYDEQFVIRDEVTHEPIAGAPYRIEDGKGKVLFVGAADAQGRTVRLTFDKAEHIKLFWGKPLTRTPSPD